MISRLKTSELSDIATCRKCGVELTDENWYPSQMQRNSRICKECGNKQRGLWEKANPEKVYATAIRCRRKQGKRPFNENKDCPQFLGVHVAERVLSKVFKDVKVMPIGNPGYDFICNKGKKIDVKSSCQQKTGAWGFHIEHNTIADYFLCLAFDNIEDLNPLYVWLIPGNELSHLIATKIYPRTVSRWDEYRLDLSKVAQCCDALRLSAIVN